MTAYWSVKHMPLPPSPQPFDQYNTLQCVMLVALIDPTHLLADGGDQVAAAMRYVGHWSLLLAFVE